MPNITINSKGTTIKLLRAEVRAMQTAYAACEAIRAHHGDTTIKEVSANACTNLRGVLDCFGEKPA